MEQNFIISAAPHIKAKHTISTMMMDTIISLIPAGVGAVIFFGQRVVWIITVSIICAIASEYFVNMLRKQEPTFKDFSSVLTAVLLSYTLPSTTPLWIVCIGSFVSIVFGKMVYGGVGYNPFNPALVGRAFLQISFPKEIGYFVIDGISTATPLSITKFNLSGTVPDTISLLVGNYSSSLGETSVILLLVGYLYLVYKKHIYPLAPLSFIATVALITLFVKPENVLVYTFSGGLFLGAIFMATDPVTTPVTPKGKIIFGIGCGILTSLIRFWGSYPEGVCFSILLMNLVTPMIDNFTIVRKFGEIRISR